jgi:microcystin-dependent protein
MSQPFVAEIRIWACNFAPYGWAFCNGQLLPISQYSAVFAVIGTFYGGDGRTTFGLPNFPGRGAIDQGTGQGLTTRVIGQTLGEEIVGLLTSEMPIHNHTINGAIAASGEGAAEYTNTPSADAWIGESSPGNMYVSGPANTLMAPQAITLTGGSLPHMNMQPYLALNFCIALQGIFPARN